MNKKLILAFLLGAAATIFPAKEPIAQEDIGKKEYEANCAVCHGISGKGDGPFAANLKKRVPSLTTLSKANNGVFPVQRVYEIIDGRAEVRMHGPRDMPIWGDKYKAEAFERHGFREHIAAGVIRGRILALIAYINKLQDK